MNADMLIESIMGKRDAKPTHKTPMQPQQHQTQGKVLKYWIFPALVVHLPCSDGLMCRPTSTE